MNLHPLWEIATQLPETPGVYLFKAASGRVLYVGKSKSLRKRVISYFSRKNNAYRIAQLLEQASTLDHLLTPDEADALILENNLIKHHQPEFNVLLKYGGGYPYLAISADPVPRLTLVHKLSGRLDARYQAVYGPYPGAVETLVQGVSRLFGLRTCENAEFKRRQRPCLRHSLGLCLGPCASDVSTSTYQHAVHQTSQLLAGNSDACAHYRQELQIRMLAHSQKLQFEQAQAVKEALETLARVSRIQTVEWHDRRDTDVLTQRWRLDGVHYQLLRYVQGELRERFFFEFSPELKTPAAALPILYAQLTPPAQVLLEKSLLADRDVQAFFLPGKWPSPTWPKTAPFTRWPSGIWERRLRKIGWPRAGRRSKPNFPVRSCNG